MILEDFVMLGRTVPEQSKQHGLVACSAGYSRELNGFVRIYPLRTRERIPRWSKLQVPVIKPSKDSRVESYRLNDEKIDQKIILGDVDKNSEFEYLKSLSSPSIQKLNQDRKSLGIIVPDVHSFNFSELAPSEETQIPLFEEEADLRKMIPRVRFSDEGGSHHLQIRDWGCFEYLRKFPEKPENLWDNLRFTDPNYEHIFFVGNMNSHRNTWLIISVISKKKNPQGDLFGGQS